MNLVAVECKKLKHHPEWSNVSIIVLKTTVVLHHAVGDMV